MISGALHPLNACKCNGAEIHKREGTLAPTSSHSYYYYFHKIKTYNKKLLLYPLIYENFGKIAAYTHALL